MAEKIYRTDQEWRAQPSPEEYPLTRKHGTERGRRCGAAAAARTWATSFRDRPAPTGLRYSAALRLRPGGGANAGPRGG